MIAMSSLQQLANLKVKEIVEKDIQHISSSEKVSKLISMLRSSDDYEAITTNNVLGLVTIRDALKVIHHDRTSVSKIAFFPPKIDLGTPIYEATLKLIRNRIRILPVIEKSSIIGVVRQRAILKKMLECYELQDIYAEALMTKNPITIDQDASLGLIRNIMLKNGFSHLPVVDAKGTLQGMITAKDIVFLCQIPREGMKVGNRKGEKIKVFSMKIRGLAERNPPTVTLRTSIWNVIQIMEAEKKNYVLVKQHKKPVGIITPRDIITILAEYKPKMHIPLYMIGFKEYDTMLIESAREKIIRVVRRRLKIHPKIQEIVVDGKMSSRSGERNRFTIRVTVYKPNNIIAVIKNGWDLLNVFDELCKSLDRRLRRV